MLVCCQGRLPPGVADLGFRQAMQRRWIKTEKGSKDPKIMRQVQTPGYLLSVLSEWQHISACLHSHF